jgi:hypothetical protein
MLRAAIVLLLVAIFAHTQTKIGNQGENVIACVELPFSQVPPLVLDSSVLILSKVLNGGYVIAAPGTNPPISTTADYVVLRTVRTSATKLTINPDCTPLSPCTVRFGSNAFQFTIPSTITLSGSSTGTVSIYVKREGTIYVGHNLPASSISCFGCVPVPEVPTFPTDSIPAYSWEVVSGHFEPTQGLFDKRTLLYTGS